MGCVWEERGLCFCGLAPRGVTIAAQFPVASCLGAAVLGRFSSGSFELKECFAGAEFIY